MNLWPEHLHLELADGNIVLAIACAERLVALNCSRRDECIRDTHLHLQSILLNAGPRLYPTDPASFERLGRYVVRVPMPNKDVRLTPEGQVHVTTPVDPHTGQTGLTLNPLEWIHQVVQQIPAPRQHMVRYYGAHANRRRRWLRQAAEEKAEATSAGPAEEERAAPRASWARLLHKVFEIDPLGCPKCQV